MIEHAPVDVATQRAGSQPSDLLTACVVIAFEGEGEGDFSLEYLDEELNGLGEEFHATAEEAREAAREALGGLLGEWRSGPPWDAHGTKHEVEWPAALRVEAVRSAMAERGTRDSLTPWQRVREVGRRLLLRMTSMYD